MGVERMAKMAVEYMARGCGMYLTIPKGKTPKGFPRGELMCESRDADGQIVRTLIFQPESVLRYLHKYCGVRVEITRGETRE